MSTDDGLHNAKYWKDKAQEARTLAEGMLDAVARETMRDIAAKYELMARRAAERERKPKS